MFEYAATVVKVIDGDTVDLTVDLGFHVSIAIRTRVLGIDAPETSTSAGKVARDRLREELPVGQSVMIHTAKDPGDKYGRWLARIMGPMGDLSEWMVAKGLAVPYFGGAKP